jgi:hypothetical protein
MTGKGQPRLRHPCRLCYRIVIYDARLKKCATCLRLEPEKPGVVLCQDCGRKLTQGSLSCVRCGKCSRLGRGTE